VVGMRGGHAWACVVGMRGGHAWACVVGMHGGEARCSHARKYGAALVSA